ncbi:putative clathrin assembly protein [Sesamum alatum]|uniref:Clathrin assembly protein n=1 Tax=Sesamum alatum TaxID=300844 RepID=A0AAE1YYQ0_9LAMI|nr:putative clathrin assembly protein [Sesamum alatum]
MPQERGRSAEPQPVEEVVEEAEPEPDMNEIKELPPPEGFDENKAEAEEVPKEVVEEPKEEEKKPQQEGDLLNLGEDAPSTEEQADRLALALFDGTGPATTAPGNAITPWEAFKQPSGGDWETALVQSASHLSNQKASLPGGFDTLILDGMYQQGATFQAVVSSGLVATGSASSVALGSAGRPAMLALPAPPAADGVAASSSGNTDPFAASLAVAPPAYVQMSEMEKKQRLLVEEQLMWQQYARDGMQGQVSLAKVQQSPYQFNAGGYTRTY